MSRWPRCFYSNRVSDTTVERAMLSTSETLKFVLWILLVSRWYKNDFNLRKSLIPPYPSDRVQQSTKVISLSMIFSLALATCQPYKIKHDWTGLNPLLPLLKRFKFNLQSPPPPCLLCILSEPPDTQYRSPYCLAGIPYCIQHMCMQR
jgi:hypothetical protein